MSYRLPKHIKTVILLAGWSSIIQAVAWGALAVVSIVSYTNCGLLGNDDDIIDRKDYFGAILYRLYFLPNTCQYQLKSDDIDIFQPFNIFIWSCVYLGLAFVWMVTSITLAVFSTEKNHQRIQFAISLWSIVTFLVCGVDLALGSLFGKDFGKFTAIMGDIPALEVSRIYATDLMRGASLLLAFVSLRGFTLWLLNFILAIVLLYICNYISVEVEKIQVDIHNDRVLHAFNSGINKTNTAWITKPETISDTRQSMRNADQNNFNSFNTSNDGTRYKFERDYATHILWKPNERLRTPSPKPYIEPSQSLDTSIRREIIPLSGTGSSPRDKDINIPPWQRNNFARKTISPTPSPDYSPPVKRQFKLKPIPKRQ